jgi:anthranilate synthase/aminodeoxychorismate synthase-like glutamine amidotransferase
MAGVLVQIGKFYMILIIDNYDSFVWNLAHLVAAQGHDFEVHLNDKITIDQINALDPSHIILSPGPKHPNTSGICLDIIHHLKHIPILGICLGHQAIGLTHGAKIIKTTPKHAYRSEITHHQQGLFKQIPHPFHAARYHSLAIEKYSLDHNWHIDATSEDIVMAIRHKERPLFGLQFHPESIISEYGQRLMLNFLLIDKAL